MTRVRKSLWMIGVTVLAVLVLLALPSVTMSSLPTEAPARVTLAQVTQGRVEQVLAVTGRIRYASEYAALTPAAGIVEQVCVRAGQRVRAGQILFRMNADRQEEAISALLSASGEREEAKAALASADTVLDSLTVRAPADGLVHQVHVTVHGGVTAGSAAVILSSCEQEVICSVVMADAVKVSPGMQARLYLQEELLCHAQVQAVGELETDVTTGQTAAAVTLRPEEELSLPLGAAVDAEIILQASTDVPVIPVEAVTENETVWWVADGRCYETPAGVVMADELSAWVSLPEGVRVVVSGQVVEGQRIREVQP